MNGHQRLESLSIDAPIEATTAEAPTTANGPVDDVDPAQADVSSAILGGASVSDAAGSATIGNDATGTQVQMVTQGIPVQNGQPQQQIGQQQQPTFVMMQPQNGVLPRIGDRGMPKMEDFKEQSQDLMYRSDRASMDPHNTLKNQSWKLFWVSLVILPLAIYFCILDYRSHDHRYHYWWYNKCEWNNFTQVLLNVTNSTHWDTHFCIVDDLVITAQNISGRDSTKPLTLLECRNECAEVYERAVHTYYWDFSVGAFINDDDGHCYCFVNPYLEYQSCIDRYNDNYYSWDYEGWCKHAQPSTFNTSCIDYDDFVNDTAVPKYGYGLESADHWSADIFSCQWGGKYNYYYCDEDGCPSDYWYYE